MSYCEVPADVSKQWTTSHSIVVMADSDLHITVYYIIRSKDKRIGKLEQSLPAHLFVRSNMNPDDEKC